MLTANETNSNTYKLQVHEQNHAIAS